MIIATNDVVLDKCPIVVDPYKDVNFKAVIFSNIVSKLSFKQCTCSVLQNFAKEQQVGVLSRLR